MAAYLEAALEQNDPVLRDVAGMTGTKYGCGRALCGAKRIRALPIRDHLTQRT